jgi:lipopolysaccharide biosynthesis glycosyltransferase
MLPTLLSAIQARRNVSPEKAEVIIFFIGPDDDVTRMFDALCRQHAVEFRVVPQSGIENLPVNFARHFLDRFLEPRFADVIHTDGDTQISGSLDPLVDASLPPGKFMATPDPMAVMIHEPSRGSTARRAYFRSIGIPDGQLDRYFNSGVFRVHRTDLAEISRECLKLCRENGSRFRFSEQDAFNIAFGRDVALMSFKWNFPVFFMNCGYDQLIAPRLFHYMSNPRPWQGAFLPWGSQAHRAYYDLVQQHPELACYLQPHRGLKAVKYRAQQRYKRLVERHTWTDPQVRARVERFEREAVV